MGREAVHLTVSISEKGNVGVFIDAWNEMLKENEYLDEDNLLTEDGFEEDFMSHEYVWEGDEIANLFDVPNDTGLLDFCKRFMKKHPNVDFMIDYYLAWDNCGDTVIENYCAVGGKLSWDYFDGEWFCSECDYEEERENQESGEEVELIGESYYIVNHHEEGIVTLSEM